MNAITDAINQQSQEWEKLPDVDTSNFDNHELQVLKDLREMLADTDASFYTLTNLELTNLTEFFNVSAIAETLEEISDFFNTYTEVWTLDQIPLNEFTDRFNVSPLEICNLLLLGLNKGQIDSGDLYWAILNH